MLPVVQYLLGVIIVLNTKGDRSYEDHGDTVETQAGK